MEISQSQKNEIVVLALEGRLDTFSSNALKDTLESLINNNKHQILIDCSELNFISSSGLRVLLSIGKQLNSLKGKIALCTMKDHIKEVFDIAGFTMLFAIFNNEEEAINHF